MPVPHVFHYTQIYTQQGATGMVYPLLLILGEYNPAGPLAAASCSTTLPAGTVQDVAFFGQNYNITLYALSYVGTGPGANEQRFKVVASRLFSGSAPAPGIQALPVSGFVINAGDPLAFAGTGPYYTDGANDTLNSDATHENSSNPGSFMATPPGGPGTVFIVGVNPDTSANYEYILDSFKNQGRTYAIGVNVFYRPWIQIVARIGNALTLSWLTTPLVSYQVQYTTGLSSTNWTNLGAPIVATSSVTTASVNLGPDPMRFYRIIQQ
jgi:hypothetical protein